MVYWKSFTLKYVSVVTVFVIDVLRPQFVVMTVPQFGSSGCSGEIDLEDLACLCRKRIWVASAVQNPLDKTAIRKPKSGSQLFNNNPS